MNKRTTWLWVLAMALVILGACDSYSLLDQFILNGGLKLTPTTSTLLPGGTTELYLEGGTAPYSLFAINGGVYEDDNGVDLGTIDAGAFPYVYTAGISIGPVTIRLRDSLGFSTSATITVLLPAPVIVSADRVVGESTQVRIVWSYPSQYKIQGFRILTKWGNAAFDISEGAESLPKLPTEFVATDAHNIQTNSYRVYAIAGPYESTYAEVVVP